MREGGHYSLFYYLTGTHKGQVHEWHSDKPPWQMLVGKKETFQVAAHVIANLYNIEVETANSPIMNQYAGSFHTHGWRRETNNLVCVALPCLVTLYLAWLPCLVMLPGYLAWLPCLVTLPGYLACLPCLVTLPGYLEPCLVMLPGYLACCELLVD